MTTSVAICTYNGAKYLTEQLESILAQETPVDEIVVCDDGSTDGTPLLLKEYHDQYPKLFRVYINAQNLGYVRNFEQALSLCTKNIIFLCDQDDVWNKDKVGEIFHYFSQNPATGIVAHDLDLIGTFAGKKTFWKLKNFGLKEKAFASEELLEHILINGNVFPGMTLAIRKNILNQYLPLQKVDSIIIHDYELIIKSLRDEKFAIVDKVLGCYRQHDRQSIGFKEKESTHTSTVTQFHLHSNHFLKVKNYVDVFNLNQNITNHFKTELRNKYSVFLKQYSFFNRIFIHLKNKYYYKIIHF